MRLFYAVDVPAGPGLLQVLDRLKGVQGAKVLAPDGLHITLKFIGEAEEAMVPSLCKVLDRSVAGIEPFTMRLRSIGCFPDPSRPRVVWAGVEDGGILKTISERLEKGTSALGFKAETRVFRPHLTLARLRQPIPGLMERFDDLPEDLGNQRVAEVKLKSSLLTSAGARHTVVHTAILEEGRQVV